MVTAWLAKQATKQVIKHSETKVTEIVVRALVKEGKAQARQVYSDKKPVVQGKVATATASVKDISALAITHGRHLADTVTESFANGSAKEQFTAAAEQLKGIVTSATAPEAEEAPVATKRKPAARKPAARKAAKPKAPKR